MQRPQGVDAGDAVEHDQSARLWNVGLGRVGGHDHRAEGLVHAIGENQGACRRTGPRLACAGGRRDRRPKWVPSFRSSALELQTGLEAKIPKRMLGFQAGGKRRSRWTQFLLLGANRLECSDRVGMRNALCRASQKDARQALRWVALTSLVYKPVFVTSDVRGTGSTQTATKHAFRCEVVWPFRAWPRLDQCVFDGMTSAPASASLAQWQAISGPTQRTT